MFRRILTGVLLSSALSSCSGGGSSGTAPAAIVPTPPSGSGTGLQSVKVSITIPGPTSALGRARRPLYVSSNTNSAAISVNGGTAVVTNLSAGSGACTSASGSRTCAVSVSAPAGSDTFSVALYASANGTGSALSQNTVAATIAAGTANTVSVTLDGIVATVVLTLANPTPPVGTALTQALTVTLEDASGAAIVGNDPLLYPVQLTDSDSSGTTKLSKTILNTPADATGLTMTYSGAALTSAVFGATATGLTSGNVTQATLTPQGTSNPSALVDWPTYGYDIARSGFNPSTSAFTPSALGNLHRVWHLSTGGGAQTQPIVATNIAGHAALVVVAGYPKVEAFDGFTGAAVWSTTLQTQNYQECGYAGLGGTFQFDRSLNALFVAGGNGSSPNHIVVTRLNIANGAVTGSVDVTPTLLAGEAVAVHGGMTLANGKLYLGTSSNCEGSSNLGSWRGRVVEVDPSSMSLVNTFFTTYNQGGATYGGGGVWSWGGVSVDPSGNVYVATGNAETNATGGANGIQAPFTPTDNEQAGYGEHLVKVSGDLTTVEGADAPTMDYSLAGNDLDYAGTPIVFQPPLNQGCGLLSATQGKNGTLVVNNTANLAEKSTFQFSVPDGAAYYVGNAGFSPNTGYLYDAITSSGAGPTLYSPGIAAIGNCGQTVIWHTSFGPDSISYGDNAHPARSMPTTTAGGVVFLGTPCTNNNNGGCGTPNQSVINGAVWAVDASSGSLLGGGAPILITNGNLRMAPTVDGEWMWVFDDTGNLYALTLDPSYATNTNSFRTAPMPSAEHVKYRW